MSISCKNNLGSSSLMDIVSAFIYVNLLPPFFKIALISADHDKNLLDRGPVFPYTSEASPRL